MYRTKTIPSNALHAINIKVSCLESHLNLIEKKDPSFNKVCGYAKDDIAQIRYRVSELLKYV